MCKGFWMKDKMKPKVTILNFNCPNMDDMNQNLCDIIKMLKYEKRHCAKMHGAFLVFRKVVLQDGKTIQTGYFC